jgi:DNA-binding beta-propeller fold protein YncE
MLRLSCKAWAWAGALVAFCACAPGPASSAPPLVLERSIPLAAVGGRIDHLAIDAKGGRLFVAELGNGSVEAIDIATGRSLGRISGLKEPQGVGYLPERDELVVATGGDGMLRFYRAADRKLQGELKLGEDADNVRVGSGRVLVGYGKALAVVDPASRSVVRTVALPAHPEGFQVQQDRAYVNLPDAGATAVVDLAQGREIARWKNPGPHFNFPLALDRDAHQTVVVYRLPAKLAIFTAPTGQVQQQLDTCGDADDVFFNRTEHQLYVICGGGAVDVFDRRGTGYAPAGRAPTRPGARTGFYAAGLDRLFVAARARGSEPAAILVFRPTP